MKSVKQLIIALSNEFKSYPIVIAYSGGVDSQVLLHTFAELKANILKDREITVCHCHHGLSEDANEWAEFASEQCEKHDLPLKLEYLQLDLFKGSGIEAEAREQRYHALQQVYAKPSLIFTGHHQDDQTETFLLALKRGAGAKGLSGMKLKSTLEPHIICRPMLNTSRKEIETFASEKSMQWVEDESNLNSAFDRNFLRNEIIPQLTQRWPAFNSTVSRSTHLLAEGQAIIEEVATADYKSALTDNGSLAMPSLWSLSHARFNNVIRYALQRMGGEMPSLAQLQQLYDQLSAENDRQPSCKLGSFVGRRYREQLYLTANFSPLDEFEGTIDLPEEGTSSELVLPDGLGSLVLSSASSKSAEESNVLAFSLDEGIESLGIRFSHDNPTVLPDYRRHSRPLKKVLQELDIPPWQRVRLPMLFNNSELVLVANQFVCQPYLPATHRNKYVLYWRE
ncbi:tRNA lysidine(34) synthetase TilS [Thalassotalea euphylliae]|uniref:tRNA lysidine(34) synthetase TilS n=1 Tax=Thalassotalea euphylliae TaxID=1655234 RepID=UPI00362C6D2B